MAGLLDGWATPHPGAFFKSLPGATGTEWSGQFNGAQRSTHDILLEGMSIGQGFVTFRTPGSDAISEFSLQTGTLSPQYGSTQTAVANFNIRSGTNDYHGMLYHALQNDNLNANGFAGNAIGTKKTTKVLNNFGGAISGPLQIPGLYDGHNRTFFFYNPEWFLERQSFFNNTIQLPTVAFKGGDFSSLLNPAFTGSALSGGVTGTDALGRPVLYGAIYDPGSTRTAPNGQPVRDMFQGNVIPPTRISTVSRTSCPWRQFLIRCIQVSYGTIRLEY